MHLFPCTNCAPVKMDSKQAPRMEVQQQDGYSLFHQWPRFMTMCAALELKAIKYEKKIVNDLENPPAEFLKLNPMKQVPVLIVDDHVLSQSLAIVELLEERWPNPPLLPADLIRRAQAREIANLIVSGIQPMQNGSGPLNSFVETMPGMTFQQWSVFWVDRGFTVLEEKVQRTAGKFSVGDSITVADICLVPQYVNAKDRYKVDVSKYPRLQSIAEYCLSMEPFKSVCCV